MMTARASLGSAARVDHCGRCSTNQVRGSIGPTTKQLAQTQKECDHDMRLTVTTNVSVDGVMQGLGGPDEDRRGGFDRGGWAPLLVDTETGDHIDQVYGGAAAFLFGRRTYEIFAGSWGAMIDMARRPIGVALNSRPKYVASTSLTDPQWAGTNVLTGDVAAAVRDLKVRQDGELVVPGSGVLVRWLLANDLVNSRTTARGITIQTYRLLGQRPEYVQSA